MSGKIIFCLTRFKVFFAAIALSMLALMVFFTEMPEIESNLAGYNVDHNPYDTVAEQMTNLFASTNMVQIKVIPEPTDAKTLFGGLKHVEEEIRRSFPGIRVESLNSAVSLLQRRVSADSPVDILLAAALDIPLAQNLVSSDTSSMLLVVFADRAENFDSDLLDSVIRNKYQGIESMVAVSQSHIQRQIEKSLKRDYLVLLPVILAFIVIILFLSFRSKSAVIFCIINVFFSFIPVVFFLSLYNISINQVTTSALPIVIILSLSTSVHLITGYMFQQTREEGGQRVIYTLQHYFIPSFLSSLTTAIAFGSFFLSDSLYIRQFGVVAASSIISVFLLTYMIAPFTLQYVRLRSRTDFPFLPTSKLEEFLSRNRSYISVVFLIIAFSSLFFLSKITFRTNLETFIPRNTEVFDNVKLVRESFHSLAEIDILVELNEDCAGSTGVSGARRELVSLVSAMSQKIAGYPEVNSVQSIKDQIDFENQFLMPGLRAGIFPRSRNPFVTQDQMKYRINVRLNDPEDIWKVLNRLLQDFSMHEPQFRFSMYSDYLFFDHISSSVTSSLLRSLLISAGLIIIIFYILTLSFRKTLISIIANMVPLGVLILIFVGFGIDMNISTSITLIVCLGLIVDDTIHILYRRVRLSEQLNELRFGILTTSIITTGGFFSFVLSQMRSNQIFGVLCGIVFIIAAISDLTIIPWLLSKKKIVL